MSVSLVIPAVTHVTASGLSGVGGPLLTDPNSQSSALPVISQRSAVASHTSGPAVGLTGGRGLDPLTPSTATTREAAALTTVINSITTTLATIQSSTGQSVNQAVSQLLQSQGFLLLFHVLGASVGPDSANSETVTVQLGDLLSGVSTAAPSGKANSGATSATAAIASSTATGNLSGTHGQTESAPYFQKLLGELAGTLGVKTPSEANGTASGLPSPFSSSELDLFLKWLSLNGSGSVVANA